MDIAYIAGITDGEGSIGIYEVKSKEGRPKGWSVKFTITGAHKPMIESLYNHYKFGNFTTQKRQATIKNPHTGADLKNIKQGWKWQVSRREEITKILEDIRPYLIEKADQADVMLAYCRGEMDGQTASDRCKELKKFNFTLDNSAVEMV